MCLADSSAMEKYFSMLTCKFPVEKIARGEMLHDEIAVAPSEMLFPIELMTSIPEGSNDWRPSQAVISHDVPLPPSFATYLPAGIAAVSD